MGFREPAFKQLRMALSLAVGTQVVFNFYSVQAKANPVGSFENKVVNIFNLATGWQNTSSQRNINTSKNSRGSNKDRVWSRNTAGGSAVAAATSPTYPTSTQNTTPTSYPPPHQKQQQQQQWGRKRSLNAPQSTSQNSPTVGDNVSSAARRTRYTKKRRPNNNTQNNTESL